MKVWFDGTQTIDCTIDDVKESLGDLGRHHVGVVGRLPGPVNRGSARQVETERAWSSSTRPTRPVPGHGQLTIFTSSPSDGGVTHRLVMSDVEANGLLGFFYRRFGSAKMGKAFLAASAGHLANRPA